MNPCYRQAILKILSSAEVALLEIVSQAAVAQNYGGIDLAKGAAEQVKSIGSRLSAAEASTSAEAVQTEQTTDTLPSRAKLSRPKKKSGYPRFEIKDSTLTKVGWSRKGNAEYTQRISREAFDVVVDAVAEAGRRTAGPVPTESVRDLLEAGGQDPPSYQVYSILAFLRSRGLTRASARGQHIILADMAEKARLEWTKTEGAGV